MIVIRFLIFDNVKITSFENIFDKIERNDYDIIITNSSLIPNTKGTIYVIKENMNFLQILNESLKEIEKKFKLMDENKYLYDKLINTYLYLSNNNIINQKNTINDCFFQKINEIIYFMFTLNVLTINDKKDYGEILFEKIDLDQKVVQLAKVNEGRIQAFINTLKEAYNNKHMKLSSVENNMKELNNNLLSKVLIENIFCFLKESIFPKIRLRIWEFLFVVEIHKIFKNKKLNVYNDFILSNNIA